MGNAQPSNRTGKKVLNQKVENAKKTGVLSLREHKLDDLPEQVYQITTLTTLDVSNNKLKKLNPKLASLSLLKSLNCDDNELIAGALEPISKLAKLQTLSAGGNMLGKPVVTTTLPKHVKQHQPRKQQPDPLPRTMPTSLKTLKLNANFLTSVPTPIFQLKKLQKLDLSYNQLKSISSEIGNLQSLNELVLDNNNLTRLPNEIGSLSKLKSLSLKHNKIQAKTSPQPLPPSLFRDTPLIDLNLHGNPMTSTEINEFDGFDDFLKRRAATNTKNIYGGAMANTSVTGLE